MRKATRNYLVMLAQTVATLLLVISAIQLWFVFPRGYIANRAFWVDIHKWSGLALAILVLIHVILHWNWLYRMTRGYFVEIRNMFTRKNAAIFDRGENERDI